MREKILQLNSQFLEGIEAAGGFSYDVPFDKIVIAGIGGSMIPGQILKLLRPDVQLNWDYDLSDDATEDCLVICISWSGNTEETISSYNAALKKHSKILVITSGGRLAELAQRNSTPLIHIQKKDVQPRMAVGYMMGALFKALGLEKELTFTWDPADLEKAGEELAASIGNRTPIIYAAYHWHSLVYFWKILFNENCKMHAITNTFPGLLHNELAGFNSRDLEKFHVLILRHTWDDPRQQQNIDLTLAMLKKIGYNYNIISLSGKTLIEKAIFNYTLALWTSYYLAKHLNVDPEDIGTIEEFKRLKK